MAFSRFCNICFSEEQVINICDEEKLSIRNHLLSLLGNPVIISKSNIYLCFECCEKIDAYNKLKEMCFTNLLEFRDLYFQLVNKLQVQDDPKIEKKLKEFIEKEITKRRTNKTDFFKKKDGKISIGNGFEMKKDLKKVNRKNINNLQNSVLSSSNMNCQNVGKSINRLETVQHKIEETFDLNNTGDFKIFPQDNVMENDEGLLSPNNLLTKMETNPSILPSTHEKPKKMSCRFCSKPFSCEYFLSCHERIHTGERPFICRICRKSFTQISHLKGHINNVHNIEKAKPYILIKKGNKSLINAAAPQRFVPKLVSKTTITLKKQSIQTTTEIAAKSTSSNESTLPSTTIPENMAETSKRKRRRVNPCCSVEPALETNLQCVYCVKTFSSKKRLIRHELSHTATKTYSCDLCVINFTKTSHLYRHQRRVHNISDVFKCALCNQTFQLYHQYRSHVSTCQ